MSEQPKWTPEQASERAAEKAIADLRKGIEAAENSAQAGENYVCMAAAGPALYAFARRALEYFESREDVVDGSYGEPQPSEEMILAQEGRAALAKAEGRE